MADLKLNITINEADIPKLSQGFQKIIKMPQVLDPDNPKKKIDKFPSVKLHAEDWLKDRLLRACNAGNDLVIKEASQPLTKEIFKKEQ